MMIDDSPWHKLNRPETGFTVRKIENTGELGIFWARDTDGRFLVLFEVTFQLDEDYKNSKVTVRGFRTDLRLIENKPYLLLLLEDGTDHDLFFGLCRTLISAVSAVAEARARLIVVFNHLKRWQLFLLREQKKILSKSQVVGLIGELLFILDLIDAGVLPEAAVNAWTGPDRSHHDFLLGDCAIEVKTLSGAERNAVRISSEDQLEISGNRLHLRIYHMREAKAGKSASSLNDIVDGIAEKLMIEPRAIASFEAKLVEAGYIRLDEYSQPSWSMILVDTYSVDKSFPRLARSSIPDGVLNVEYDVALECITGYRQQVVDLYGLIYGE